MVYCALFGCLDRSKSRSDSRSSEDTKRTSKEEVCYARSILAKTIELQSSKSVPSTIGSLQGSVISSHKALKFKVCRSISLDILGAHECPSERPRISLLKHQGPRVVLGGFTRLDVEGRPNASGESKAGAFLDAKWVAAELSSPKTETTMISDWNECYMSEEFTIRTSQSASQRPCGSNFSQSRQSFTSSNTLNVHENPARISLPVMAVSPGMVWAMVSKKNVQAFGFLNLSFSLRKVVDTFLKEQTGSALPISFMFSTDKRSKILSAEKMSMTLSEILEGYLDEATQGVTFFVGPVNGKLCYKMSVCDLKLLQRCFATQ